MTVVDMPRGSDIFDSTAEALVNPVNCVGVMGRGLASEFRRRFPAMYDDYTGACARHELWTGRCRLHYGMHGLVSGRWDNGMPLYRHLFVISFPTKYHWKERSVLSTIYNGMASLVKLVGEHGIGSVAIPALGCGLGGLRWATEVRPVIVEVVEGWPDVRWELYGPRMTVTDDDRKGDRG